jgi:GNAT superfamily N-acetyltransferase
MDGTTTTIAAAADAEVIAELINRAYRVERFFIAGDRIDTAKVRELLATGTFLLAPPAAAGGPPAGCVYVEPRGERAYLGLLSVDPASWRGGLGTRLMAAAEEHCRAAGCAWIDLRIVNVRQGLPAFYHRLGYVATGTSDFPPGAPLKVPCHFVEMSKPLR